MAFWRGSTAFLETHLLADRPVGTPAPTLVQVASDSGDDCHYNLHHVSDNQATRLRKKLIPHSDLFLCVDGTVEQFTVSRAVELVEAHYS